MRYEASATCLSWIPPTAVQGVFSLPFGLGIAHYDQPPPDELPDVETLLATDAIRFANQVHAWIEVEDGQITSHGMSGQGRLGSTTVRLRSRGLTFAGVALPDLVPPPGVLGDRVVFTQSAGGHTGAPVPRPVTQPPFWRLAAPVAWTTVTVTLHADGTSAARLAAASPFPRHFLYDNGGRLTHKSALIRYKDWIRRSGREDNPWVGGGTPVPVTAVKGPAERSLGNAMLLSGDYRQHTLARGMLLSERPIADSEVHLLLDGLLLIEIDRQPAVEVGPGAIFDPSMRTPYSKEHVTVRARTASRLAVLPRTHLDDQALVGVAAEQTARLNTCSTDLGLSTGSASATPGTRLSRVPQAIAGRPRRYIHSMCRPYASRAATAPAVTAATMGTPAVSSSSASRADHDAGHRGDHAYSVTGADMNA